MPPTALIFNLTAEDWQAVGAIVGVFVVTPTLFFLAKQQKEQVRAEHAAVHQSITDQMLAIDRFFFENPEMRPYFYDGVEPPPHGQDRIQVDAVAEMMLDFFDNTFAQCDRMHVNRVDVWTEYARATVDSSPAMRAFLHKHRRWYCGELVRFYDKWQEAAREAAAAAASDGAPAVADSRQA